MKHFKHLCMLFAAMLLSINVWGASPETFTFEDVASDNSWSNGVAYTNVTLGDFTFEVSGGGNNGKYYTSDVTWRFYSGGGLTITPGTGTKITAVSSNPTSTFTVAEDGSKASISFSGTVKYKSITVTYTSGGSDNPTV